MRVFIFLVVLLASCSPRDRQEQKTSATIKESILKTKEERQKNIKENRKRSNFNILNYKKGIDSLVSQILSKKATTKLLADTIKPGNLIFIELKRTQVANITLGSFCVKYSFLLEESSLKHNLITLTFNESDKVDSAFVLLKKVASEKSGVPGLTYTSDYLTRCENQIYWVNSNCSYSYINHLKFVDVLKENISIENEEHIACECGKVLCLVSKDTPKQPHPSHGQND